jgi:hypothetical protein
MDPDTIQKVAAELAKHLSSYWWALLGVQFAVMTVAAASGAFFGEYLRTRGKNLATKADFDALQDQLKATTQLVETVKADVAQKDWARREWTNLRRIKLEELFDKVHDCIAYLETLKYKAVKGLVPDDRDPLGEIETIATLYFSELTTEFCEFRAVCHAQKGIALELGRQIIQLGTDMDARQRAIDHHKEQYLETYPRLLSAISRLEEAGRSLLTQIMGVAE